MTETITNDTVEKLRQDMDKAHQHFSESHWATETAKGDLGQAAKRLSELVGRRSAAERSLTNLVQTFVQALTGDPATKVDPSKITSVREEVKLLDAAITRWKIEGHADAERAYLVAIVDETQAQLDFEHARLAHHEAEVHVLLSQTATLDGSVELARPGDVSLQMRELCADIQDKLARSKNTLQEFDRKTADARDRFEEGQNV